MRRARVMVAGAVIAVIAAGTAAVMVGGDDDDPVDRALARLEKESAFDSSREAVVSFAAVYEHLAAAVKHFPKACDGPTRQARCIALNQAASWSLAFSPASGQCIQPAIQEGRIALRDYVRLSAALDDDAAKPPPLPPIPFC